MQMQCGEYIWTSSDSVLDFCKKRYTISADERRAAGGLKKEKKPPTATGTFLFLLEAAQPCPPCPSNIGGCNLEPAASRNSVKPFHAIAPQEVARGQVMPNKYLNADNTSLGNCSLSPDRALIGRTGTPWIREVWAKAWVVWLREGRVAEGACGAAGQHDRFEAFELVSSSAARAAVMCLARGAELRLALRLYTRVVCLHVLVLVFLYHIKQSTQIWNRQHHHHHHHQPSKQPHTTSPMSHPQSQSPITLTIPASPSQTHYLAHSPTLSTPPTTESSCPICYESWAASTEGIIRTHCGHAFHRACLAAWFGSESVQSANTCPSCRAVCFPEAKSEKGRVVVISGERSPNAGDVSVFDLGDDDGCYESPAAHLILTPSLPPPPPPPAPRL
ncbi:hypothetical protein IQ07DRAFT_90919 [Pyrenochaeta sp. DS3sAY3a]|nr:hypothetical protein IQ07DRAFT_90919 [Pyrenochaeta sp. DS3sAY3a]